MRRDDIDGRLDRLERAIVEVYDKAMSVEAQTRRWPASYAPLLQRPIPRDWESSLASIARDIKRRDSRALE